MFGILFGTACLIGLIKTLRHGRYGYGYGMHGGGRGGFGPKWLLRSLFERLETTPGQEKVILEEFEAVRDAGMKFRDEAQKAREDVAKAMRGEHVDQEVLNGLFARQDQLIENLRRTFSGAVSKVHEALDADQRKVFADLIDSGRLFGMGRGRGCHGGYRRSCGGGWRHGHGYGGGSPYTMA